MNNKLSKISTLVASEDQISAALPGEESGDVVILSLKDGVYYELNAVGARVWSLIQEPNAIQSVLETLLSEFDVSPEACEADILHLAQDLLDRGLVKVVDPQSL